MSIWIPVPLLCATLFLLLRADARTPRDVRQVTVWKPLTTLLIVLVCALSFTLPADRHDSLYSLLILLGLLFSLAGDVLLIPPDQPKAFLAGLVAFLLAHLLYIAAFLHLQTSFLKSTGAPGELFAALALVLLAAAVYAYLRPGLGRLRGPVIAYMVVISVMVHRALAIAWVHPGPATQPLLIAVGAVLFYLSDAILAINKFRFGGELRHYKLLNLSTYYAGQLLLALSASFVG
jgi:uncharacterized membrane protein YhhN